MGAARPRMRFAAAPAITLPNWRTDSRRERALLIRVTHINYLSSALPLPEETA